MFGTMACMDCLFLFFYVSCSFGLGTSLSYVTTYLKLTYQGFTKKELRSVEVETEKVVKCVDPYRGLSNMLYFFVFNSSDKEKGASELQKRF